MKTLKKIMISNIVFVDGKTIKDRYNNPESELSLDNLVNNFININEVSWDEEKKILVLETKKPEIRKIKIGGVWYSVGDIYKAKDIFFIWSWFFKRKLWKIIFIGNDSSAQISDGKNIKTLTGEVKIFS